MTWLNRSFLILLSLVFVGTSVATERTVSSPVRAPRSSKELKPARVKRKLVPKKVKAPESAAPAPEKPAAQ